MAVSGLREWSVKAAPAVHEDAGNVHRRRLGRTSRLGRAGRARRTSKRRAYGTETRAAPDDPYASHQPLLDRELEGDCRPGACGEEAACKRLRGGAAHLCLCPHDSSPPTEDLKCPIRLIVPLTPKPIHNIIPPSGGNLSVPILGTLATARPTYSNDSRQAISNGLAPIPIGATDTVILGSGGYAAIGGIIVAAVAALILAILCFISRRSIASTVCGDRKPQPVPQTGEPLLAERYILNPQYIPQGEWGDRGETIARSTSSRLPLRDTSSQVSTIDRESLSFIEETGEGCFGKVYKGSLRRGNMTTIVAVKVLKDSAGRNAEEDFMREVNVMSSFRHPNILELMGVVLSDRNISPWMVFEFMPYGDLAGVLRAASGVAMPSRTMPDNLPPLDDRALLYIALQVANGMQYLASRRFVHRDLACRNCLVGEDLCVKIADFGLSRDVYTCDYYKMGGERPMPVRWMSPESIVYARFTLESDIWSFGVLLWEIYSRGKQPFYGHNNEGATKLILQGIMLVPPEECPRVVCELMRACWRSDPRDRATFGDVVGALRTAAAQTLPLPPPAILPPRAPLLDTEGYLLPIMPDAPIYLDALPDPPVPSPSDEEPG